MTVAVLKHPTASVTFTVKVPAHKPLTACVKYGPLGPVHKNEYGGVPPEALAEAVPLQDPKQLKVVFVVEILIVTV